MDIAGALYQPEKQAREQDPVKRKQWELQPVRINFVQWKEAFLSGVARLRPRVNQAARQLTRLSKLAAQEEVGHPPELGHLWKEIDQIFAGIPPSFDEATYLIDS